MDWSLGVQLSCTGCGAKVGAGILSNLLQGIQPEPNEALLVGFEAADDACVYRVNDEQAVVQTLDFFPPMVPDPYLFGQIAATNAISDVFAMGGEPVFALNIFAAPRNHGTEVYEAVLRGGYDAARSMGVAITGGHSIYDETLKYGLSVTGFVHPDEIWRNRGAQAGDLLYLTQPLGVGISLTAFAGGLLTESQLQPTLDWMLRSNGAMAELLHDFHPSAVTDVTGFALLGHLKELIQGSESVRAVVRPDAIPLLPDVLDWAAMGILPEAVYNNKRFVGDTLLSGSRAENWVDVLCDPQTSGGLLFSLPAHEAPALEQRAQNAKLPLYRIGWIETGTPRIVLL